MVTHSLYTGISGASWARNHTCCCPKDVECQFIEHVGAGLPEVRRVMALADRKSCGRSPRRYFSSRACLASENCGIPGIMSLPVAPCSDTSSTVQPTRGNGRFSRYVGCQE